MRRLKNLTECGIIYYVGYQGTCLSVAYQTEVEKSTTSKERSDQPSNPSTTKQSFKNQNFKKFFNWKIGQINIQSR